MDPGQTHLRPRAGVPGDVWKITARLNQTTRHKSWRPDSPIIRLKAKRGHLGIEKEREETVSVQLQNKRSQESREEV